MIEAALLLGSK
jgi:hypothetical protein